MKVYFMLLYLVGGNLVTWKSKKQKKKNYCIKCRTRIQWNCKGVAEILWLRKQQKNLVFHKWKHVIYIVIIRRQSANSKTQCNMVVQNIMKLIDTLLRKFLNIKLLVFLCEIERSNCKYSHKRLLDAKPWKEHFTSWIFKIPLSSLIGVEKN